MALVSVSLGLPRVNSVKRALNAIAERNPSTIASTELTLLMSAVLMKLSLDLVGK
jgi:hypothetical protein